MTAVAKGKPFPREKSFSPFALAGRTNMIGAKVWGGAEISHETAEPTWFSHQTAGIKVESSMLQREKLLLGLGKGKCSVSDVIIPL